MQNTVKTSEWLANPNHICVEDIELHDMVKRLLDSSSDLTDVKKDFMASVKDERVAKIFSGIVGFQAFARYALMINDDHRLINLINQSIAIIMRESGREEVVIDIPAEGIEFSLTNAINTGMLNDGSTPMVSNANLRAIIQRVEELLTKSVLRLFLDVPARHLMLLNFQGVISKNLTSSETLSCQIDLETKTLKGFIRIPALITATNNQCYSPCEMDGLSQMLDNLQAVLSHQSSIVATTVGSMRHIQIYLESANLLTGTEPIKEIEHYVQNPKELEEPSIWSFVSRVLTKAR